MHLFFQYLLFLVQIAWLLFAEHTSLFLLLLPVPPTLVRGSTFCPAPLPHGLCDSASFKTTHAGAERGPVQFRFGFLTGPVSISLLTALSPCSACVLCFYCLWHSYLPLPLLFSLPPFPHGPLRPFRLQHQLIHLSLHYTA